MPCSPERYRGFAAEMSDFNNMGSGIENYFQYIMAIIKFKKGTGGFGVWSQESAEGSNGSLRNKRDTFIMKKRLKNWTANALIGKI